MLKIQKKIRRKRKRYKMLNNIIVPEWVRNIGKEGNNKIVITDDMDALLSFYLLKKKIPQLELVGFYDFKTLHYKNTSDIKDSIWIDCDTITRFKSMGNHRTYFENPENFNLNHYVQDAHKEYHKKFPLSTAMSVLFYFYSRFEIDQFSDDMLRFILTVDSAYKGYYKDGGKWKIHHINWLKRLGQDRFLEILENSKEKDFDKIKEKFDSTQKLIYQNGIETEIDLFMLEIVHGIDLESIIAKVELSKSKTFNQQYMSSEQVEKLEKSRVLTMAETYKGKFAVTLID